MPPEPDGDDETRRRHLDDASVDAAFADIVAMWRADAGRTDVRNGDPGPSTPDPAPAGATTPGGVDPPAADEPVSPAGTADDGPGPDTPVAVGPGSTADSDAIDEIFAARRRHIEREIDAAVDGPDGGHYVPGDPAPLPQLDLFTVLAWLGALLGPVLIVISAFTGGLIPRWVIGAAVAATIGGFVLLVSRLPRRGEADPDDNGAVV